MKTDNTRTPQVSDASPDPENDVHDLVSHSRYCHFMGLAALLLAVLQALLVLVSWIISSLLPGSTVRSMLSSDGVRWFFNRFVDHLASPPLVWLLLIAIAWGAFRSSGMSSLFSRSSSSPRVSNASSSRWGGTLRQRYALLVSLILLVLFVVVIVLLSFVRNAVLLGTTGRLFPSPFSHSLLPMLAFVVTMCSLSFGLASRRLNSISSVMQALTSGFQPFLPVFVLYILVVQLFYSIIYVFFN